MARTRTPKNGPAAEAALVAKTVNTLVGNIGTMTDSIFAMKAEKSALQAQIDEIDAKIKVTETDLIERLEAEGSARGSGRTATCSISKSTVFQVNDWAAVEKWALAKKMLHIFQRRLTNAAVAEIHERGSTIPGTEPVTVTRLNVRAIS